MAKQKNYTCIQTSFHNVNTSNASSGLRENVMLTNLVPKFGGKYGTKIWDGEREGWRHPWMDILTPRKNFHPLMLGGGPDWVGRVTGGGVSL